MEGAWAGARVGLAEAGKEWGKRQGCYPPAELTQQLSDSSLQAGFGGRVGPTWEPGLWSSF